MRALWITMTSVGVMCLVAGLGSFIYAAWVLEGSESVGLFGNYRPWRSGHYAFLGTVSAALGAGFITAGVLGMRGDRLREERARQTLPPR